MINLNFTLTLLVSFPSVKDRAVFRAKLNPVAAVPLTILPNKRDRVINNGSFQSYLCDRMGMMRQLGLALSSAIAPLIPASVLVGISGFAVSLGNSSAFTTPSET